MNCLCDMTQFVISIIAENPTASLLAKLFAEQVIFTFGMVAIIVVDTDSKFKKEFQLMCDILKITFWSIAKGNHKSLSVERYHRFLNKTQTIRNNDINTPLAFYTNIKTSQYAWNSAPIDETDIPRCVAAIGRDFKFPLDVEN